MSEWNAPSSSRSSVRENGTHVARSRARTREDGMGLRARGSGDDAVRETSA